MTDPSGQQARDHDEHGSFRAIFAGGLKQHSAIIASLAIRGGAVMAGFAVTYLIGRNLGASAIGQFALVSQTALMLAVIGLLGLDVSIVRHFAKAVADGSRVALKSLGQVLGTSLSLLLAIMGILWLGGDRLWEWLFADAVPFDFLLLLCLLLIGRAGANLCGAFLRSQHAFAMGQIVPALIIPVFTTLALAFGFVDTVRGALWAAAIGSLLALAIGAAATLAMSGTGDRAAQINLKAVIASALPLWGVGIAQNIGDWYGLVVAAQILGAAEAGLFRVGFQVAAILQVASVALFSVYSAKISTAFHAGSREQAAQLAATAVRLSSLLVIPAGAILIGAGPFVLGQIGPEFAAAYPVLIILIVGQIAFTVTGPCGLVLAMSGNERINLGISIVSIALLLILAPIAAKIWGLAGLAACVAILTTLRNVLAYFIVFHREGISIWRGTVSTDVGAAR